MNRELMKSCRKILIALDESQEVLKHGIRLAQDEKAWVTVLKVVPRYEGDLHLTGIKNLDHVLSNDVPLKFADMCTLAESEGAPVKTRVLAGDITDRIVEVADEERCDLIIMGAKKRKGILARIFGDNIVEKVIDRATCPVYVVGSSFEAMPEQSNAYSAAVYHPRTLKA